MNVIQPLSLVLLLLLNDNRATSGTNCLAGHSLPEPMDKIRTDTHDNCAFASLSIIFLNSEFLFAFLGFSFSVSTSTTACNSLTQTTSYALRR